MSNLKRNLIVLFVLVVLLIGFFIYQLYQDMIPNVHLKLNDEQINKLNLINTVELRKASYFDITCKSYEIGENSYYLISSDGSRRDDFAKWSCGHELKYINCPSMKITLESDNTARIETFDAFKDEYNLKTVKQCAEEALKNAPMEFKPTSDKVINELNAESNISSFNQD